MSYGPPSDPNQGPHQPDPGAMPHQVPPYAQQPWPAAPNGQGAPIGPTTGPGLGVVSLVLGLLGIVVPFLPIDETGARHWIALPFALGGVVLGVAGLVGPRRGKPVAGVGLGLSVLALLVAMAFVGAMIMHG